MKTPRLIPVVIAASTALLLFKGIGLMTSGSYVLGGTTMVQAAGAPAGDHGGGAAAEGEDPTLELPTEATMTDQSPTMTDEAETLPLGEEAVGGAHGEAPAAGEHDETPAEGEQAVAPAEGEHAAAPAEGEHGAAAIAEGDAAAATAPVVCAPDAAPAEAAEGHGDAPVAAEAQAGAQAAAADCVPGPALTADGDALPHIISPSGAKIPMPGSAGELAEPALLERLGERRDELDARDAEIALRLALVEAAERRLEERAAELKALESQITVLVEQKKAADQQQFVAIVAMYETMKPKDAAVIFSALDLPVLTQVVRQMNPRKMGPILAKMDPNKVKVLTALLARQEAEPTIAAAPEDLTNLPQIVGQ